MKLNLTVIRVEMAKSNLNQSKLANLAGIERSTLCMIMNGKSVGRPDTWQRIANAIGVSVTDLIEE